MKNKKIFITISILLLLFAGLTSCYTDYVGNYNIGKLSSTYRSKPASEEDYKKLYKAINKVALEYGFEQSKDEHRDGHSKDIFYYKGGEFTNRQYEELEGSKEPFYFILRLKPYPSIRIIDHRRNNESEFMKSFKIALEKSLSEVIDMEGVFFEREFSLPLGP